MKPKLLAFIFGLAIVLFSSGASAEPLPNGHIRLITGSGELIGPDGKRYFLPVGTHILDGTSWDKLDQDVKETKNLVTRYKAENESLKRSLTAWQPGWGTLIVMTSLALAIGGTAYYLND